jgi:hypothetical protein
VITNGKKGIKLLSESNNGDGNYVLQKINGSSILNIAETSLVIGDVFAASLPYSYVNVPLPYQLSLTANAFFGGYNPFPIAVVDDPYGFFLPNTKLNSLLIPDSGTYNITFNLESFAFNEQIFSESGILSIRPIVNEVPYAQPEYRNKITVPSPGLAPTSPGFLYSFSVSFDLSLGAGAKFTMGYQYFSNGVQIDEMDVDLVSIFIIKNI